MLLWGRTACFDAHSCLTSQPRSICSIRSGLQRNFFWLFSCHLVKVVYLCVRFSTMLWYASATFSQVTFIAFVLILWHETSVKWEIKAVAEMQQWLFSCLPYYILLELSLVLIYICYTGAIFIHAFFLCSPLFGFLFQAVTLLYCSCVHNSTAVIFMKVFSQTSLVYVPQGLIKVLIILTIHVNNLNFNYLHMQINSTHSLYL